MWNGNDFIFSFDTQPGRTYEMQSTDALGSDDWQVFDVLSGNGSSLTFTNTNPTAAQTFYRVQTK